MSAGKTPVTALHEYLQKRNLIPTYNLIHNGTGTHEPTFKYEVVVEGKHKAIGIGKSKKEAKHCGARIMLDVLLGEKELPVDEIDTNIQSPYADVLKDNAVGLLQDFCSSNNLGCPDYKLTRDEGLSHDKVFRYKATLNSFSEFAEARTKKQAKQLAAQKLYNTLVKYLPQLAATAAPAEPKQELEVSELALKKIESLSLGSGKGLPLQREALGLPICDYHKALKDPCFLASEALQSIKGVEEKALRKMEDPLGKLQEIMSELGYEITLEELPTESTEDHAYMLALETVPRWVLAGWGKTKEEAIRESFVEALVFLSQMTL